MRIRWMYLFLDTPAAVADGSWSYWSRVTSSTLSPVRGEHGQFATLLPPSGSPWIKVQAVAEGPGGVHLDLDTDDRGALVDRAVGLGATVQARYHDVVVLSSPAGIVFCATTGDTGTIDRDVDSIADQACLDIPRSQFAREVEFWRDLTAWPASEIRDDNEFVSLTRPAEMPVRILLQRRDDETLAAAHVDFATRDRAAETARHVREGAEVVRVRPGWTVMRDPFGRVYCLTDRDPGRGSPR
ncbi:MAG: VOC family protein [Actinobacteria bacterium]|nr:VOC family protein [Actinomycetota bacterium]